MMKTTEQLYDNFAGLYDRVFTSLKYRKREYKFILRRLPEKPRHLLDYGCGNGIFLKEISAMVEKGTGVDSSKKMTEYAEQNTQKCRNINIIHNTDSHIPFPDREFDCVVFAFSLRYMQIETLFPEIRRICKKNGLIIITGQFSYGSIKPPAAKCILNKLHFFFMCLFSPMYYFRLRKLVSMPEWRSHSSEYPGQTIEQFLNTAVNFFSIETSKQLSYAFRRTTWGIVLKNG